MDNEIRVQVDNGHIESGRPKEGANCPLYHALRPLFPGKEIWVGDEWCEIGSQGYDYDAETQAAIFGYDATGQMMPFEAVLWRRQ